MKAKRMGLNRAPEHAPALLLRVSKTTLADLVWMLACERRKEYVETLIEVHAHELQCLPSADVATLRTMRTRAMRRSKP